jgi:hypothetical protein
MMTIQLFGNHQFIGNQRFSQGGEPLDREKILQTLQDAIAENFGEELAEEVRGLTARKVENELIPGSDDGTNGENS